MVRRALVPSLACLAAVGTAAEGTGAAQPSPRELPSDASLAGTSTIAGTAGGVGAVERLLRNIRWGAYGEVHYTNFQTDIESSSTKDRLEVHRFVLLGEAQLAERWSMVTEIEIEHGYVRDNHGYVALEQAYLDWRFHDDHSARAGVLLVPISIGNLYHEPTLFHGVERPYIDSLIVPTTWYEAGVGVFGKILPNLDYGVALQAGLDSSNQDGQRFRGSNAIRDGRQFGFESDAEDFMGTARVDWRPLPGLWLAGAANYGGTDQEDSDFVDAKVLLYTLEARYNAHNIDAGVTWAQGRISDADDLTAHYPADTAPIPEVFEGLSAFVAYDVLPLLGDSEQQLFPFVRYELIDTQAEVPDGTTANEALSRTIIQYGLTWKPVPQVAIKADYRDEDNDSDTASIDSWSLGAGFAF